MNAYELADELENKDRLWSVNETLMLKTCAMLRQQADRIAELEKPVKQLSDEEIKDICKKIDVSFDGVDTYRFARAIIKEITE